MDGFNESQWLLKALQKDKETLEENLVEVNAKVAYTDTKEKSMRESLDATIASKKE